jgi:hypothetical protein
MAPPRSYGRRANRSVAESRHRTLGLADVIYLSARIRPRDDLEMLSALRTRRDGIPCGPKKDLSTGA